MSLVHIINKVLKSDKDYNISKLGDNGVEFSAPCLYMGNFVLYDCEKNFIFLQGSRAEFKEDVTGLSWEEIAEAIIFKLDWRKRLGAIVYQPEDEKKELFCDKVNSQYVGKSDPNQTSTLKKEVQDGLGNYFHKSDIDNSKVEMYDAEPFMKQQGFAYYRSENGCPVWDITRIGCLIYSPETVKQITPDIQHVITPSKNYFLFKLSK